MDFNFIIAIATIGWLGFIFAGGLAFADKKLRVEENPLIGKINELLPNANCGGYGWAGCYDFALNVVEGKAPIIGCPVGGNETSKSIAELLGKDATSPVRMISIILCKGGNSGSMKKSTDYFGPNSCKTLNTLSGGNKLCFYGCLGSDDCVAACPFGAMIMKDDYRWLLRNCVRCVEFVQKLVREILSKCIKKIEMFLSSAKILMIRKVQKMFAMFPISAAEFVLVNQSVELSWMAI